MTGMDEDNTIAPGVHLPDGKLQFTFARSGGPGGQNVNKLNTKATLTVQIADLAEQLTPGAIERLKRLGKRYLVDDDERLVIDSEEHRSQTANRQTCLDKLRALIIRAKARPKVRKPTKPTRASKERRIDEKKQRGKRKDERRGDWR